MSTSPEASLYLNVWSSSVLSVKKTWLGKSWHLEQAELQKQTDTVSTKPVGPAFHLSLTSYDIKYPILGVH